MSHQAFGKENVHYNPVKAHVRGESSSTADSSPQEQSRPSSRNIKRKVLRKKNGESRVFDESFTSTDSGMFGFIIQSMYRHHLREVSGLLYYYIHVHVEF